MAVTNPIFQHNVPLIVHLTMGSTWLNRNYKDLGAQKN